MTPNGTYVIRKGRKKDRKAMESVIQPPDIVECDQRPRLGDLKRCSSTFDNIKSLLKEGLLEGLDEAPPDFSPPMPPGLVRVVSLPSLASEGSHHHEFLNGPRHHVRDDAHHRSKADVRRLSRPHELAVTMEEEEDAPYCFNPDDDFTESDVNEEERRLIEQLEKQQLSTSSESLPMGDRLLSQEYQLKEIIMNCESVSHAQEELKDCRDVQLHKNRISSSSFDDVREETETRNSQSRKKSRGKQRHATAVESDAQWSTASEMCGRIHAVPVVLRDQLSGGISDGCSEPGKDFTETVEMLQHEFPPLPPSPVEEDDDEYSEILHPSPAETPKDKASTLPEPFYRSLEPPGSDPCGMRFLNQPPEPPPHQEPVSSLKTRSMDAGFSKGYRNHSSGSRREVSRIAARGNPPLAI
jgi:hypothetical protein